MDLIKPMLATTATSLPSGTWIAEEKFDGHRLLVMVNGGVLAWRSPRWVRSWSRTGKTRELTPRLRSVLSKLPVGIYDGELIVPQGYSSSVSLLSNSPLLQYVVFDLLQRGEEDMTSHLWHERRQHLEDIFEGWEENGVVTLAETHSIRSWEDAEALAEQIWERGGEGVILKDTNALYRPGKRTRTFLKLKQCQAAVLTIIGFAPSEGEVNNYGDFGTAVLLDPEGIVVPVKVLDDATRARLAADDSGLREWKELRLLSGAKVRYHSNHAWVGRGLHIEYQQRTPDGSFRHPRWDRLDGE